MVYNGESSYGRIIHLQSLSWLYHLRYALVDENTIFQFKTTFDFRKIDRTAIKSIGVALPTSRDFQRVCTHRTVILCRYFINL